MNTSLSTSEPIPRVNLPHSFQQSEVNIIFSPPVFVKTIILKSLIILNNPQGYSQAKPDTQPFMRFLVSPFIFHFIVQQELINYLTTNKSLLYFVYLSGECGRLTTSDSHGLSTKSDLNRSALSDSLGDYGGYIRYMATTCSCYK